MTDIDIVSEAITRSEQIVVFSGAGTSTESGIPDFRGPKGIWAHVDPNELTYQKFMASEAGRERHWDFSRRLWPIIAGAIPNPGHHAIADLYHMGKLDCIITQNIDGLYQKAGIPEEWVIEVHGTALWVTCLDCGKRYPREEVQLRLNAGERAPGANVAAL
jgi:NAD-dependent deacetylase